MDYKHVLAYIASLRGVFSENATFLCGYEAGCLGFTLYHQLTEHNVNCVILAPTTMPLVKGKKKIKTDKRDARNIAKCLAHHDYSPVHIPTEQDEQVKEYVRMRTDHKLSCFLGVQTQTALSSIVEVGDFKRFSYAEKFASYPRLVPGEDSSGDSQTRLGITKAGNPPEVIAYADKANERLRRKYYKMVLSKSKKANVAKTAVARELACFMWGMMTGNIT